MIVDCIADLHGEYPILEGGDLLILAGDYTSQNKLFQWCDFFKWLKSQPYRQKVLIAGNHDGFFESGFPKNEKEAYELKEVESFLIEKGNAEKEDFVYLCDSGSEFEGLKIWGSPWSLWFKGINPHCTAFSVSEFELFKHYSLIPSDVDILVTHSPPYGILDRCRNGYVGSIDLRNRVLDSRQFPNLKLHVFGHIHECGGKIFETPLTKFVNASYLNEYYKPKNNIIRIKL